MDPYPEKRLAGLEATKKLHAPMAGKLKLDCFEMLDLKVQRHGDAAILTYSLEEDLQKSPDAPETQHLAWNSTQVHA